MLATRLFEPAFVSCVLLYIKTRGSQNVSAACETRLRRVDIGRTRRASQTIYYSIEDANFVRILWLLSHIIMLMTLCCRKHDMDISPRLGGESAPERQKESIFLFPKLPSPLPDMHHCLKSW